MLIVDTDPGTDDAVAIMMLLAAGAKVDAFVSVFGNVPIERTSANLQRVLNAAGEVDSARYQGATSPLLGTGLVARHIHGEDGLSGAYADVKDARQELPLVDYRKILRDAVEPVTIIALGPLTNIASAIAGDPELSKKIGRIILMGGAVLTWGNTTPAATFNLVNDPVAAAIVYDSGIPLVQAGLDVCRPARIPVKPLMKFKDSTTPAGRLLWSLVSEHFMIKRSGGLTEDSIIQFNDAPSIAYFLKPELFESRHLPVVVESEGKYTRGATIADFDNKLGKEPNTEVLLGIDVDGYAQLVTELLLTYA